MMGGYSRRRKGGGGARVSNFGLGVCAYAGECSYQSVGIYSRKYGTQGLLNELELRGFVFTVQGGNFRC